MTTLLKPIDVVRTLYLDYLVCYVMRAFTELRPGATFHMGFAIRAICHQLERVARGEVRRLMIVMPPRHLKSHCASVAFPVWLLGQDPSARIICMSYGQDLSETFSRDSRRLIEAPWNQAVFPGLKLDPKRSAVSELRTTQNGYRIATSVGGAVTGKGADILILDDPSKAEDIASQTKRDKVWDWFTGTAMTRLDNPRTGAVIVVAQRLHEDDLPGRLLAAGGWEVLELPAIETHERVIDLDQGMEYTRRPGDVLLPDHMGKAEFEAKRREMGTRAYEAQYQQAPTPAGGGIVRTEWFGTIPQNLRRSDYEAIVQSWDTAAVPGESNDYSVCTTWGLLGPYVDLLDVHRQKYLQPDLLRVAAKLRATWKPALLIVETIGSGRGVFDHLRRQSHSNIRSYKPKDSKVERLSIQSPKIERGEVRLPQSAQWKEAFLSEVAAFPNGKHDDQVDNMSQVLFALDRRPGELRHCSRFKG